MRVLILTSEYPPSVGGVGNACAAFAREMSARGWDCEIVTGIVEGQSDIQHAQEGVIHRLLLSGDASLWSPFCGDIPRLKTIITDFKPQIIVIHGWQGWCVKAVPLIRAANIPIVLQSHGFGLHRVPWHLRPPFGLKAWAGNLPFIVGLPDFIKKLHRFSVLSREPRFANAFDHWVASRFKCQNVVTIPNGVEKVGQSPSIFLQKCPAAINKRVVLYVANYCERKNQLLALDVARLIRREDIFFTFIGGEPNAYFKQLEKRMQSWGLENYVALFHSAPRSFTESAIQACEVAVMTSKWEMQPLFLLEAMSAGKPWVSLNVGSVCELRGGIIAENSTQAIASSILQLMNEIELKNKLGDEGLSHWGSEFSHSVVYNRWHELLLASITK